MRRSFATLSLALLLSACSGGGSGPVGNSGQGTGASRAAAALSLSLGTGTAYGTAVIYPLTLNVTNSAGQTVTGTYVNPIVLTTNNGSDTGFSTTANGSGESSSISVTSSTETLYFYYNGAALASDVTVTAATATAGTIGYDFEPGGTGTSSSASQVSTISVAINGSAPLVGESGSFTLTVAGYTASGLLISGAYSNPITVTTNDAKDLQLSIAGGTPASSVTLTSASQILVATYDGATVPASTMITASASGATSGSASFNPGSTSTTTGAISTIKLAQIGAEPNQGTAGEFALTVTASDASGNPVTGTYATPIVVTSNDTADLQLSTTPNGGFSGSTTVASSSTTVYVNYSGSDVPQNTQFAANEGTIQGTLPFDPAVSNATKPYLKTLYVSTAGAPPFPSGGPADAYGSQPIYIEGFDQNGNQFVGNYPTAVNVTANKATDLTLSVGSYSPATECEYLQPGTVCPNVAAVVINNSSQVVFGDYTPTFTGGQISVTATGIECAAINFPLANGSTPYTCQALNPTATPSPDPSASASARHATTTWRLVRIKP